ncbi:MAG: hypothetical protein M3008_06555, partial [Chloroflexota bacterium]|nr:hypothetical protein [Chloroflexota bacterium]
MEAVEGGSSDRESQAMNNNRSRAVTRRAFAQRVAIVLGTLITAACAGNRPARESITVVPPPTLAVKPTPVITPSPPPNSGFDQMLSVDASHPNADDANPGTADRPLKTIAKAADIAVKNNLQKISTRVVVSPGVYRESIFVQAKMGLTDTPMHFEAKQHGTVTIAGSDLWTGWAKQATKNTYTHPWPYKWGLQSYPQGWQGNVTLQPIVRRREMIFIDGKSLVQVL